MELIEQETGNKAELTFGPSDKADVPATWASIQKAKALLGWEPQVSLEEGIRRSVAWYMENRELASKLVL